jgi:hypothetical protein
MLYGISMANKPLISMTTSLGINLSLPLLLLFDQLFHIPCRTKRNLYTTPDDLVQGAY